ASGPFLAIAELRDADLRQGDRDQVLPLLADHLTAADVLAEIAFDLAANDPSKSLMVPFDLLSHGNPLLHCLNPFQNIACKRTVSKLRIRLTHPGPVQTLCQSHRLACPRAKTDAT